ncbi:MAG: carbohydrate kinase family protein [Verrucomicrobiae bacterium]|nr:carbohydrate kinase family protein [Verrucomicrobiae bacterium]
MQKRKERRGIFAGGNWIVDQVKIIDAYPHPEHLANILNESQGTGGAPYNVLVDLSKLGVDFPLFGAGLVGNDALGKRIFDDCKRFGINTKYLHKTDKAPTSYTDVMTEKGSGRRTFFHNRGANALWDAKDIEFGELNVRIFHLGYLLLLDTLDKEDAKFGTRAAHIFHRAQAAGIKTSVDVVSEDSDRFPKIVLPALKYINYCILNELEAGRTTGLKIRQDDGNLNIENLRPTAEYLFKHGVKDLVVIHFPEGAYALDINGNEFWQGSVNLPENYIAGTAGAGDAFCAGTLLGLHEGWDIQKCLSTGSCVAAVSLSHPTCTEGIKPLKSSLAVGKKYGFKKIPNKK